MAHLPGGKGPGGKKSISIAIPLKPREKPIEFPEEEQKKLRNELDVRYLESIGVAPSKANIAVVRKFIPNDKVTYSTAWKSRGWVSDTLFITLQDPSQAAPVVAARRARAAAADIGPIDRLPTALHEREAAANASGDAEEEEDAGKSELQLAAPSGSMAFADGQRQFLYPYRHLSAPPARRARVGVGVPAWRRPKSPLLVDEGAAARSGGAGSSSLGEDAGGDAWSVDDDDPDGDDHEGDGASALAVDVADADPRGPHLPPISPAASPTRRGKFNFTSRDPMKYAPLTEREVLLELAQPLELHTRDILTFQHDFLATFPFDRLRGASGKGSALSSTAEQPDAQTARLARDEIAAPRSARFIGMLALFLYRFHMRERCRQPADDVKLGALLCAVQQYFASLRRRMMTKRKLLLVVLPALLLSVRMSVEALFRHAFKKWWTTIDGRDTLARMDAMVEEMFDPNSYHSHIAPLESSTEAIKITSRSSLGVKPRGDRQSKFLATSTLVSTALPKAPLVKHRRNLAGASYPSINEQLAKLASAPVRQSLLQAARAEGANAESARLVEAMIARPNKMGADGDMSATRRSAP